MSNKPIPLGDEIAALMLEALRHSANHMAVFDPDDRLVAWSAIYERFHQPVFDALRAEGRLQDVRYPEFVARSLARHFPPDRLGSEVAERVAAHRAAGGRPVERYIPGMGWYHISKVRTPSGATVTTGVDIGALKAKEAELEAARMAAEAANAAKAAFLANMSHEFRTPLNGVLGVGALLAASDLDSRQRGYLELMRCSAEALLRLVDDLLEAARVESERIRLRAEPFSPAAILAEAAGLVSARLDPERLALRTHVAPSVPARAVGDPVRVRQILWNLLGNAANFTERGWIAARLDAEPAGDRLRLIGEIEDTGPGVPEGEREAIFERFARLPSGDGPRTPGAGLGLSICRGLCASMGGDISVTEGAAGGALFRFTVTLAPAPPDALDGAAGGD